MFVFPHSPGEQDLTDLQARFGVSFRDEALLLQALTHPSWAEEDALFSPSQAHQSQAPLVEIGGKTIVNGVTQCLRRDHPHATESGLWRVAASYTRGSWAAQCGRVLGLDDLMRVGSSAQQLRSYDTEPIARTLKAMLGALSADGQDDAVERLITTWFVTYTPPTHEIRTIKRFSNQMGAVHDLLCGGRPDQRGTYQEVKLGPDHRPTWRLTYDLTARGLGVYVASAKRKQHAKSDVYDDIFRDAVLYGLIH